MTTQYVTIPLDSAPYYTLSVSLEGNSYNLDFLYNERTQLYHVSLFDADNIPIVEGVGLVPEFPIFADYAIPNLSGYLWLGKKASLTSEPYKNYPDRISEYYELMYVYTI